MSKVDERNTATRSDQIVRAIEEEIISGRRAPGSHLNEQEIADRFNVSRTPVREAVRHLSSAGLVEVRPRRGAFVARVPITRLIQMFEVMSEIEGTCARLAARRMPAEDKQKLKELHDSYAQHAENNSADSYYDESIEFHRLIFRGTQNEVLAEMATRLYNQLTGYRRRQLTLSKRVKKSFREHAEVLDAILDGDEDRAEKAMRDHTHIVGDNVMDLISTLGDD
ncbi:MAG: GntR family transcriptional regulator [Pseudomonadota bacterium]